MKPEQLLQRVGFVILNLNSTPECLKFHERYWNPCHEAFARMRSTPLYELLSPEQKDSPKTDWYSSVIKQFILISLTLILKENGDTYWVARCPIGHHIEILPHSKGGHFLKCNNCNMVAQPFQKVWPPGVHVVVSNQWHADPYYSWFAIVSNFWHGLLVNWTNDHPQGGHKSQPLQLLIWGSIAQHHLQSLLLKVYIAHVKTSYQPARTFRDEEKAKY